MSIDISNVKTNISVNFKGGITQFYLDNSDINLSTDIVRKLHLKLRSYYNVPYDVKTELKLGGSSMDDNNLLSLYKLNDENTRKYLDLSLEQVLNTINKPALPTISDLEWTTFTEKYGLSKYDVVKVPNIFRHPCEIFVHKNDVTLWNEKKTNTWVYYYHFCLNNSNIQTYSNERWSKSTICYY